MAAIQQTFFYKISDIQNIANLESVYALDASENPEATDRHVLGSDEATFFKRLLRLAGAQIYKRIHRRARGVTDPYQFDVDYEGEPGYLTFTLIFPENFDASLVPSVDAQLQDCLVFHVLSGWFAKTRRNVQADDYAAKYQESEDELKSLIEMRTYVERRSYFFAKYNTE